jgi:pimeloyl-ACP methyl ester carboxylesterase
MKTHEEEMIYVTAHNGPLLIGARFQPRQAQPQPVGIVLIHGNTGKFCDYPYVMLARQLAGHGYTVINGNTRGHDISATLWKMPEDTPMAGGSAWELLEASPDDLAAWLNYAEDLGLPRCVLIGHSQGAAKVVYYQAQRRDPRLHGIVLASPDLHGHWPPALVAQAQSLVAMGQGNELLPAILNTDWYRLSANNIVSRATILNHTYTSAIDKPFIADVHCPILALFGTAGDVGGAPELDMLRQNAVHATRVDTKLVPGADHVYTNQEAAVAAMIAAWINSVEQSQWASEDDTNGVANGSANPRPSMHDA